MQPERNFWHPAFTFLVRHCGPSSLKVRPEFAITSEPQRADILLVHHQRLDPNKARIMKGLWAYLPRRTLIEFKSVKHPPRCSDWMRLLGYTVFYDTKKLARVRHRNELAMVLVTPSWTPTLEREAKRMGWTRVALGDGYYRMTGGPYASFVVLIDEVAQAEQDPILGTFMFRFESAWAWFRRTFECRS